MTVRGKLTAVDRIWAFALGLGVAALAWWTGNSAEFPPELWDDFSVAAGLRPPLRMASLLWHNLVARLIPHFGIDGTVDILRVLGPVSLGVLSLASFRMFSWCLPGTLRTYANSRRWGRILVRSMVSSGVLLLVFSEPFWSAGRIFSPEILHLGLTFSVLLLAIGGIVERFRPMYVILIGAVSGVLAAESPFGFLPPVAVWLFIRFRDWDAVAPSPDVNETVVTVALRRMILVFSGCWTAALVAAVSFFRSQGGIGAGDGLFLSTARLFCHLFASVGSCASPVGWVLVLFVVVAPLVFLLARLRNMADDTVFLDLRYGFFLLVFGMLALLQSSGLSSCWFWRWIPGVKAISSPSMLAHCMLLTSMTAFLALSLFVIDACFRNYRRLVRSFSPVLPEDVSALRRLDFTMRLVWRIVRPMLFYVFPAAVVALVLPKVFDSRSLQVGALVNAAVHLTAAECADAPYLFSDGALDAAVEVAAAADGRRLKAVSMMSGSSPAEIAVRTHGVADDGLRADLAFGAANALRTWVRSGAPVSSNIAVQVGFELWRHDNLPMPSVAGLTARNAGFPPGEKEKGIAEAKKLAERILELRADAGGLDFVSGELQEMLSLVQWRISRMCRMRANSADMVNDTKSSESEHDLADRLDAANPQWRKIQERMDWVSCQEGVRLAPREGLRLGLDRADFRLAQSYARQVLAVSPDDVHANFAMGMSCFTQQQYGRAERFLKIALKKAPDEPAILNNLAVVLLRLDRFDEAETNALRALKAYPSSPEIKETLRRIRKVKGK